MPQGMQEVLEAGSPELKAAGQSAGSLQSLTGNFSNLLSYASDLHKLESASDPDLQRISMQMAIQQTPGQAPKLTIGVAQSIFDDMRQEREKQIASRRANLAQAIDTEAGRDYAGVFGTPDQQEAIRTGRPWKRNQEQALFELAKGAPPERRAAILTNDLNPDEAKRFADLQNETLVGQNRKPQHWYEYIPWGLTALARGSTGVLENLREQEETPGGAAPTEPPSKLADLAGRAAAVEAKIANTVLPFRPLTAAKYLLGISQPAEALGHAVTGALSGTTSVGGVSSLHAPDLGAAAKAGWEALKGTSDQAGSAFQGLQATQERWKREAMIQALKEDPRMDRARAVARANELYQNRLASDPLGYFIEHPNEAQLASEVVFDPLQIAGPLAGRAIGTVARLGVKGAGTAAGAAARALTAIDEWGRPIEEATPLLGQKVAKATQALRDVSNSFQWLRPAKQLEQIPAGGGLLGQSGADAAELMRLANAESQNQGAQAVSRMLPELQELQKLTPEEAQRANDILTARRALAAGAPTPPGVRAGQDLAEKALGIKQLEQIGNRFESDILRSAKETAREHYVPQKILSESGREKLAAAIQEAGPPAPLPGESLHAAEMRARSARERTLPSWLYEPNPAAQWEPEIADIARKVPAAHEVRALTDYMEQTGFLGRYNAKNGVMMIGDKPNDVNDVIRVLSERDGVPWQKADHELRDTVQLLTGKPGEERGARGFIAPAPVVSRLQQLAPILGGTKKPIEEAQNAFGSFVKNVLRPTNLAARVGATILGGPMYILNNFVGAVGLGQIGLGMRLLNPKLQGSVAAGALLSAGLGSQKWRALKFALRNGEETTIGNVVDLAHRAGVLDQFELRAGLEALKPRGVMEKVGHTLSPIYIPMGEKLSSANINRAVENWQKLIMFMGSLEDTTPRGLARALKITGEFSGNYRRISPAEQLLFKDAFMFYSWNRFVIPHMISQIAQNPQRFAIWAKARGYFERKNYLPGGPLAMPEYLEAQGIPSAEQPAQEGLHKHDYSVDVWQDPISMMTGPLSQILKGDVGSLLVPWARVAQEIITGRDARTGDILATPPPIDPVAMAKSMGLSGRWAHLPEILTAPADRMSANLMTLYKVLHEQERADLSSRYAITRRWGVLAELVNAITGKDLALGSTVPGVGSFYVQGLSAAARKQKEAADALKIGTQESGREGSPLDLAY